MKKNVYILWVAALAGPALYAQVSDCSNLPDSAALKSALIAARSAENSGLNAQQWAAVVNRYGFVCAVAYTGNDATSQLGIGRVSAAMRANTGNAFAYDANSASNGKGFAPGLALSSSNLYSGTQPGSFVGGITENYPVNQAAAFGRNPAFYGTTLDPMIGQQIGGFTALAGGMGLYGPNKVAVGGIGVAGDHPCTDHDVAWRTRNLLNFDHMLGFPPVSGDPSRPDNIVYDITPNINGGTGVSASGLGYPKCPNAGDQTKLPAVHN